MLKTGWSQKNPGHCNWKKDADILQVGVTARFMCDAIFSDEFITNLLLSVNVKVF